MTLMDEPFAGSTPHEALTSNPARRDRPRMSMVIPVPRLSEAASTLERLPRVDGEVILVGPRRDPMAASARARRPVAEAEIEFAFGDPAALRVGFAAARGERIVVLDRDADIDADGIERFVAALDAGCRSVQRPTP